MKEHNAFRAVGELDDDILALAEHSRSASYRSKKTRSVRTLVLKRILPIAACFCLLLSSVLVIGGMEPPEKPFDPHDASTWQARNQTPVTLEQCQQVYLFSSFEEIVAILGKPYMLTFEKEFWKPTAKNDSTIEDYATFLRRYGDSSYRHRNGIVASWQMEDGNLFYVSLQAIRSDAAREERFVDPSLTVSYTPPHFDFESKCWYHPMSNWIGLEGCTLRDDENSIFHLIYHVIDKEGSGHAFYDGSGKEPTYATHASTYIGFHDTYIRPYYITFPQARDVRDPLGHSSADSFEEAEQQLDVLRDSVNADQWYATSIGIETTCNLKFMHDPTECAHDLGQCVYGLIGTKEE